MNNKHLVILVLAVLFLQCGRESMNLIQKNRLGDIGRETRFEELDRIFEHDSIEKFTGGSELVREYRVFDQEGRPLLVFVPRIENDTVKGMERVKIFSDAYVTEKGISTSSPFKDIAENYTINRIEPSFSAAILFVDEINATISLDKKDLNLDEFDMSEIRQDQIPDLAGVKYITLWFD